MPFWSQLIFQDSVSPLMKQLIFFHDHALIILILILTLVGGWMVSMSFNLLTNRHLLENQSIELVWTLLPMFILIFIALPSLRLLYLLDETNFPSLTVKVMGNQWYWSYEFSDFPSLEFDSYMVTSEATHLPRLLEVDNRLTLPSNCHLRLLISASDVIHSWTIPALSVKADAIPGRLNQLDLKFDRPGIFYGQCSEICGANHSFMPIVIESVSVDHFNKFIS